MAKNFKKVISTFISLTTITWSVGIGSLALPNVASAATLSAGDLIKASGPAVYYYGSDAKRYVFPNEKTYFSWYTDFSSVKTITDAELAAIAIGSNVTIRPGTKLVKITTDPKTYAVTKCGVLHWIESETVAKALYGDAWNTRVVDVPDGFFVNYTVGSSIATNVHPNGQVVTYTGDTYKYVVWNGVKRKFTSDAAYAANMLNPAYDIMTAVTYGNGSDVAGREADLADVVCGAGTVVGGALTAALASDTPAGMNVPKNASSVALVKVNFTAGTGDVLLTGLRFHRVGVGAAADFSNVYLYDASGKRLTTGRTVNSSSNTVEFNSLSISISAGQTWSALVYGDFSTPTNTGGQHAFELVDAASVVVSGSSTVSGSFPVRGNVFTVGTTLSARVDVTKGAQPSNPVIGTKGAEISNFKLTANTNDVKVNQITLYQAGSVTNSDLTNLKLKQGTTEVASASGVSSDGRIIMKFTNPYLIANGTTKVFSLVADVGGRAARTIRTYVEYTTDVTAIDQVYNAGASICITSSGTCTTGSFDGNTTAVNYIEVTTQGGQLTNAFNGPATSNVAKGQLAVPLYKFALTSPDNALEIKYIRVSIAKTAGSAGTCYVKGTGTGTALDGTNYFRSIKIKNMDTGATVMGPTELSSSLADQSTGSGTLTFSDSFNISAGQTMNLALVADLSNSEDVAGEFFNTGACAYQATFQAFQASDVRVVDTGEFLDITKIVPNSTVTGNALTVKASRLEVALASQPVSDTLVKKQQNVPIAGLVLTASAESDITITSLTLTGQSDRTTAGCAGFGGAACNLAGLSQRVTSLALYDGETQVGLAKAPDTVTGKAQISNMNLVLTKGTSKTLTVKASLSSTASSTSPYDKIAVGMALTSELSAQDQDSNTVTPSLSAGVTNQIGATPAVVQTIIPNGTLTVQADAHPAATIVVAGKDAWIPFAQYKATAQYEQIDLDRIAIYATPTTGVSADNADFAMIAVAQHGAVKGQDVLSSGATGTKDIDLTSNKVTVAKGGTATFQLWAKLSNVQTSSSLTTGVARSGHAPALGLNSSITSGEWDANYEGKLNIRAVGNASGERVYATTGAAHGNSMVLRKTVPIVTKQSLSSTTLTNTSQQDLIKFQVAADANGSISLKQIIFNLSKDGVSLNNFRIRRGTTDVPDADVNIVFASSTGLNEVVNAETGTIAETTQDTGFIIVSFASEETMSGAGNVYTLYSGVSGAASGDNVTVSFYRAPSTAIVTGYLINSVAGTTPTLAADASIYHLDTAAAPAGTFGSTGTFLWSDNSEVPHSTAVGTSRDWTNDVYVQDVSQSQTISL